jgi:amino acid permease
MYVCVCVLVILCVFMYVSVCNLLEMNSRFPYYFFEMYLVLFIPVNIPFSMLFSHNASQLNQTK